MNARVKEIRKALNINQEEFGRRLGVTVTAISKIEKGINGLTDQMLLAVCHTYNVNEHWLRSGEGEMFVQNGNADIDKMIQELGLSDFAADIAAAYHKLEPKYRDAMKQLVAEMLHKHDSEIAADSTLMQEELSRKEQANLLRARADALEKEDAESTTGEKHA